MLLTLEHVPVPRHLGRVEVEFPDEVPLRVHALVVQFHEGLGCRAGLDGANLNSFKTKGYFLILSLKIFHLLL